MIKEIEIIKVIEKWIFKRLKKIDKNINKELINNIRYLIVSVKELVFVTMVEIILLVLVFKWYESGCDKEFEYAELPSSFPRLAAK